MSAARSFPDFQPRAENKTGRSAETSEGDELAQGFRKECSRGQRAHGKACSGGGDDIDPSKSPQQQEDRKGKYSRVDQANTRDQKADERVQEVHRSRQGGNHQSDGQRFSGLVKGRRKHDLEPTRKQLVAVDFSWPRVARHTARPLLGSHCSRAQQPTPAPPTTRPAEPGTPGMAEVVRRAQESRDAQHQQEPQPGAAS